MRMKRKRQKKKVTIFVCVQTRLRYAMFKRRILLSFSIYPKHFLLSSIMVLKWDFLIIFNISPMFCCNHTQGGKYYYSSNFIT